MTAKDALTIDQWIPVALIKATDIFKYKNIMRRAKLGIAPDSAERKLLNEIYCYTKGGGDKEQQPFKQYRRKPSWGI
jgi:hypothetical protein